MHGLIFETSVWLLAESTRLLPSWFHGPAVSKHYPPPEDPRNTYYQILTHRGRDKRTKFHFEGGKTRLFYFSALPSGWGSGVIRQQGKGFKISIRDHQKLCTSPFSVLFSYLSHHSSLEQDKASRFLLVSGLAKSLWNHHHWKTNCGFWINLDCLSFLSYT